MYGMGLGRGWWGYYVLKEWFSNGCFGCIQNCFSVGLGYYVLKNALKAESFSAELVVHNVTNNEPNNKTKKLKKKHGSIHSNKHT